MRLYLSSFGLGRRPSALLELVSPGAKVTVVLNALDNFPDVRARWLEAQIDSLAELGFEARELDLRNFFGATSALAESLRGVGLIWINGGNAFILRRAMRQSGFDEVIRPLLDRDEIAYGGFSAAAVVAGPTLRGFELIDDAFAAPDGYQPEIVWEGLGLVPEAVAVHVDSRDEQGQAMEQVVERLIANGTPYLALRDGEALAVDGNRRTIAGRGTT